jgi:hypothetical protein
MIKWSELRERCWPGYKSVPGKKAYSPGSCVKESPTIEEDLRKWFSKTDPKGGWKRINSKGEAIGPCAREPGEPKPKCMSNEKRASLSKKERASAVASKRKHDPNPERKGPPINVSNFGKGKISEDMENLNEKNVPTSPEKWAQAKAQAKSKFDVYPSAYANGWAAKKYKAMGGGWKSVNEVKEVGDDPTGDTPPDNLVRKGTKVVAKQTQFEETEMLDELSNNLLSRYKSAATKQSSSLGKEMQSDSGKTKKNTELQNKRFSGTMKATTKQFANDMKNEAKDPGEYDQEGDMAKSDLRSIIANAQKMHDMIDDADNLPEWVQSKITKAEDYISTVANYMTSEMSEEVKDEYARKVDKYLKKKYQKEDVENLEEGRPSQRHPLEGHEYHKKSDEALVHIAKDAHAAAEAMKSHNPTAENKYRDQANDSATVRHYRKTHGMADWYKKKYGHINESDAYDKDVKPSDKPHDKEAAAKRAKIAAVMARKKMAKEEVEQLDELSPSTLQSYKVAGHKKYDSIRNNTDADSMAKKSKLEKGIKTAHAKQFPSKPAAPAPKKDPNSRGYEQGRYMGDSVEHDESLVEGESWKVDTGWKKSKSDEVTDKSGAKHTAMSRAKHLAKMAAKKNANPTKSMREDAEPVEKEPEEAPKKSRKAQIVKDAKKSKTASADKFQSEPELGSTITKNY